MFSGLLTSSFCGKYAELEMWVGATDFHNDLGHLPVS